MTEVITDFHCKLCKKYYASYQSLWIHNKKFHNKNVIANVVSVVPNVVSVVPNVVSNVVSNVISNNKIILFKNKQYNCKLCKKEFNDRRNKWRHEKICQQRKQLVNNKIENNKSIDNTIEKKFEEFKNTILDIIQKEAKIHPKTLQKINKQLINNNSNNTINNNGTIINNTFVKFGNEQLSHLLKHKDMLKIINKQCLCIEESIKTIHFNKKLPEYNNIFITNMKDTIAYIFDGCKFILTSKDEVINNLYNNHLENIEQFLKINIAKLLNF
jgi:hypothetical protein